MVQRRSMPNERYQQTPAMLHSINQGGLLEEVSDVWLTKLGYSREEVLGRPSTDFLSPESARYAKEVVLPRFFETGECVAEYEMLRRDGTRLPVRLRAVAIRDAQGKILRSNAVLEDMTEHRRLEQKMLQAQKLESLGLMAGSIAHDCNNLLVSILGNTQLALEDVRGMPSAVASLTDVVTASQRAADLCRQLLAYSGRGKFTIEEVDVSELAREMTQILELSVGRFAAIKLELARPGPRAEVDPTQLRQVVMNLVLNAAEALDGGRGLITVVTSLRDLDADTSERTSNPDLPLGRYVRIGVADTGRGTPAELLDRIFDPFFTTKAAGRGLGLAAVHGIVRSHSGMLRVDSEPGRGTSFKVYLPAKPSAEQVENVSLRKRGTVLIVDDDEMVRQTLHRQLTRAGFEAVLAANGEDAVLTAQARGRELTAFLIDVTMPGLSGPDVFLRLRSLLPTARVVLMSGYNHVDIVRRYTTEGLAGFVQKPFTIQEVMRLLEG